jgi:CTP synthase (UTP-ammonia lyase)
VLSRSGIGLWVSRALGALEDWDMVTIGIIGDYDATRETHLATVPAVQHAASALGVGVRARWIATEQVESDANGVLGSPGR